MHQSDNSRSLDFSPGSIAAICSTIDKIGQCLLAQSPDIPIIKLNTCGNGIVDGNEQCDCGLNCGTDSCCDTSCKFKAGAVCSDANSKCCSNCQIKAKGQTCRDSLGGCDYAEQCDGNTAACPVNQFVADGQSCSAAVGTALTTGYCASGICTSRDVQCKNYSALTTRLVYFIFLRVRVLVMQPLQLMCVLFPVQMPLENVSA